MPNAVYLLNFIYNLNPLWSRHTDYLSLRRGTEDLRVHVSCSRSLFLKDLPICTISTGFCVFVQNCKVLDFLSWEVFRLTSFKIGQQCNPIFMRQLTWFYCLIFVTPNLTQNQSPEWCFHHAFKRDRNVTQHSPVNTFFPRTGDWTQVLCILLSSCIPSPIYYFNFETGSN